MKEHVFDTTYYNVLRVPPNATQEEITKSYRKLALQYHPDKRVQSTPTNTDFHHLNDAYTVLSDPETRALYDLHGPQLKPNTENSIGEALVKLVPFLSSSLTGFCGGLFFLTNQNFLTVGIQEVFVVGLVAYLLKQNDQKDTKRKWSDLATIIFCGLLLGNSCGYILSWSATTLYQTLFS